MSSYEKRMLSFGCEARRGSGVGFWILPASSRRLGLSSFLLQPGKRVGHQLTLQPQQKLMNPGMSPLRNVLRAMSEEMRLPARWHLKFGLLTRKR